MTLIESMGAFMLKFVNHKQYKIIERKMYRELPMKIRFWRPICIDSIHPEYFPDVALFLRTSDNYVLYKNWERKFSFDDYRRLERNNTEFLYARTGDMEEINTYLENNLTEMLANDDISGAAKGKILYQALINFVTDIFESPETVSDLPRCRNLIQQVIKFVATEKQALDPLQSIISQNLYIVAHSVQVAAINLLIHDKLFNLTHDEMINIGVGSLLHDFGMVFISEEILDKPNAISDVEYYKVKQHTQKGYEFLKQTGLFNEVALNIVRHHHERYDGNGYPTGINGDLIHCSAQMSAICNAYCAMTTSRIFRKAVSHADAFMILRDESEQGAFNSKLLSRFEEVMDDAMSLRS
jgi:HD-GYP domain-containing protein (c-di-GMP phosphodiesterase class II)